MTAVRPESDRLIHRAAEVPSTPTLIHPTAIVEDGAALAEDVEIGPYCVIGSRAKIAAGCRLYAHVVVDGNTTIGARTTVFPFATLGTPPQDKKLEPGYVGTLVVGSDNQIRENVTIHGGTHLGRGQTRVGDHNMLLAGCHIGHDALVGDHTVFTNGAMAAGHSVIHDHAILGAMVGVHQFARVGEFAMIGAGAMLSHDAPPYALVQGDRARLVGVNKIGLTRSGFDTDDIAVIKRVYRLMFWRGGVLTKRLEEARSHAAEQSERARIHAERIIDFVAESTRGICATRGRNSKGDDSGIN